jgi:hypothetical protein
MPQPQPFGAGGPWAELLTLPRDSLGFVRRECAACHRTFKVKGTQLEGMLVFLRVAARVTHQNEHESRFPLATRTCPYCGARGSDDAWFTAEQRNWLDKRADTLGQELRYEQLAHVERTLADNQSPTFLPVRPDMPTGRLRPEPDDMRAVPMLCCLEEIKISEHWLGPVHCFYCGLEHEMGAAVIRDRLARLLEPG